MKTNGKSHINSPRSQGAFYSGLTVAACLFFGVSASVSAATYTYDFGAGTGTVTTGADLPAPASGGGTAYARVGTGGGGLALNNPGNASLGTGSELTLTAPTSTSLNKFDLYSYTAATTSRLAFSAVLSGSSGKFDLFTGTGSTFSSANAFSGTQSFTGLEFTLGTGGSVATTYRSGGSFVSTGLTTTGITTGTVLNFVVYGNNSASSVTYSVAGTNYTVAAGTQDIFLNGALIGDDLAEAQLASGTGIDSLMFYGQSSTGNVGTLSLDDLSYGSITPAPEPATCLAGALLMGAAGWSQRRRLRGLAGSLRTRRAA